MVHTRFLRAISPPQNISLFTLKELSARFLWRIGLLLGLAFIGIIHSTISVFAQGVTIDPTFRADTFRTFPSGSASLTTRVKAVTLQTDGKAIIGGWHFGAGGVPRPYLTRLNQDGTGDESFSPPIIGNNSPEAIAVQPDGKIIVCGTVSFSQNGVQRDYIARLNSDGSLDPSFEVVGQSSGLLALAIQPDGKILVGGAATNAPVSPTLITRLNPNGSVDPTFVPVNETPSGTGGLTQIKLRSNGKILISGSFGNIEGQTRYGFAQLNADGTLDVSYAPDFATYGLTNGFDLYPDGRVALSTQYRGIVRLLPDGTEDETFTPTFPGIGYLLGINGVVVQPDGKVVGTAFGTFISGTGWAVRFNDDGSLDSTFQGGIGPAQPGGGLSDSQVLQPDGKLILVGSFKTFDGIQRDNVVRLNTDGSVDQSYNPNARILGIAETIIQTPNGQFFVEGDFNQIRGVLRNNLARLNHDGSVDETFQPNLPYRSLIEGMALQSDGKLIICGSTILTGTTQYIPFFKRLNLDGTQDSGFSPNLPGNEFVNGVALQPDGKVIAWGNFSQADGNPVGGFARFNTDGSYDTTFMPEFAGVTIAPRIAVLPSGKILVPVQVFFGSYLQTQIFRLNSDGTTDSSFSPIIFGDLANVSSSFLSSLHLLSNDGLLVTGGFETVNGFLQNGIARLNADGSLDSSYTPQISDLGLPTILDVSTDGRALITGLVASGGVPIARLGRITSGGVRESSFEVEFTTLNNFGSGLVTGLFQSDGKMVIGGGFTSVLDQYHYSLVRLADGEPCQFLVSPVSAAFPSSGGTGSLSLTGTSAACPWTSAGVPDWISGIPASGTGSASMSYSVAPNNTKSSRSAVITIGGQTFTLTQAAPSNVNTQVNLVINSISQQAVDPAPGSGYTNRVDLNATLTNFGSTLYAPLFFEVLELSKPGTDLDPTRPYRLSTADDFTITGTVLSGGQVGSLQTVPLSGPIATNGQVSGITFSILRGVQQRFRFFVSVYASTSAPLMNRARTRNTPPKPVASFLVEIENGQAVVTPVN